MAWKLPYFWSRRDRARLYGFDDYLWPELEKLQQRAAMASSS